MLKTIGTNIELTRGDTAELSLDVKKNDGTAYDFSSDTVVFTVKKSTITSEIIFQKSFNSGEIKILPEDTAHLNYGTYKYDVQITTPGGDVYTVIEPSDFTLTSEVTFGE